MMLVEESPYTSDRQASASALALGIEDQCCLPRLLNVNFVTRVLQLRCLKQNVLLMITTNLSSPSSKNPRATADSSHLHCAKGGLFDLSSHAHVEGDKPGTISTAKQLRMHQDGSKFEEDRMNMLNCLAALTGRHVGRSCVAAGNCDLQLYPSSSTI